MSGDFDPNARRRELDRRESARERILLAAALLSLIALGLALAALWETYR